jgi:hypothetical protein
MSQPLSSLTQQAPAADFIERLSRYTQVLIEDQQWTFGCEVMAFTAEQVAAPDYLLPLVLHRANRWIEEGYGQPAPMDYRHTPEPLPRRDKAPLCAVVPEANEATASIAVWALFIKHALQDVVDQHQDLLLQDKQAFIPLDDWYKEFLHDVDNGLVLLLPAKPRLMIEPASERPSPLDPGLATRVPQATRTG